MFTNEQIKEISARLAAQGSRDSQFPPSLRLKGDETVVVVQDGVNRNVTVDELFNAFRDSMYVELGLNVWLSCWRMFGVALVAGLGRGLETAGKALEDIGAAVSDIERVKEGFALLDGLKGVVEGMRETADGILEGLEKSS